MFLDLLFFLNFISQEFNEGLVSFRVQSATAARAGNRGLQEARAPSRAGPYAEQTEGPEAWPGRGLQEMPKRLGRDGGSEAGGGGAEGARQI